MRDELKGLIDYVITYEELMGMLQARQIELGELEVRSDVRYSSSLGRNYA